MGLLASGSLFELYSSRYLFPKADFVMYLDIFFFGAIVPIVLLNIFSYFFIYFNLSYVKERKCRKSNKFLRFTPAKTIISTFTLFLVIGIMIIFGLSSNSMFTQFVGAIKLGNNYSEMINLQYMMNDSFSDDYEPFTKVNGSISKVNNVDIQPNFNTVVYGINPTNNLKLLIDDEIKNNLLLIDGVIISDYLHASANLNIGDSVTYKIGNLEHTASILGISNELIENNIYMDKETLNGFYGIDNSYYNGLFITDDLFINSYVTSRIDYQNSLDEFASLLNVSSIIMSYLVTLSIILSLYIFSLNFISYLNDNRTSIAILKSIGFNNMEINFKYLKNIYLVFVISFLLAIPFTKLLLNYLLEILMKRMGFKLILSIDFLYLLLGFLVLNFIFFITILLTNKYYDQISISDLIKNNTK